MNHLNSVSRVALKMREQKVAELHELTMRKTKEIRLKTARANKMRDHLATASKMSRENLLLRRISSAQEIRTKSRFVSPRNSN